MRINSFAAEQFAGLRDRSVRFAQGLNVVEGRNEAGKSTMISAMFRALTEPFALDKRRSKDFIAECFPSDGANFIDVKLNFTENGEDYRLTREWDKNGKGCLFRLKLEDGSVLSGEESEKKLRQVLGCSPAILDNLVFGRQNHSEAILSWCYEFFSGSEEAAGISDAKNTVAAAFSAAGGISPDKFSEVLAGCINDLGGRWDHARREPERGKMDWKSGTGTIVRAYYAYKKCAGELSAARDTEMRVRSYTEKLTAVAARKTELEKQLAQLRATLAAVENAENIRGLLKSEQAALAAADSAVKNWPRLDETAAKAAELLRLREEARSRSRRAELSERIERIKRLEADISALTEKTAALSALPEDCRAAEGLAAAVRENKRLLGAGSLRADIHMNSPHKAQISFADGSSETLTEGAVDVRGFFRVVIPEVGEMTVSPADTDVAALLADNERCSAQLDAILGKYSAEDMAALRAALDGYNRHISDLAAKKAMRSGINGSAAELESALAEIVTDPAVNVPENLDGEISAFLSANRQGSLEACIAHCETAAAGYKDKFGTAENAAAELNRAAEAVRGYEEKLASAGGGGVTSKADFDRRSAALEAELTRVNEERDRLNYELGGLENAVSGTDIPMLETEAEELKAAWEHEMHLYECYLRIREDFSRLLESRDSGTDGFTERFAEYLAIISGSRLGLSPANGNPGGGLSLTSGDITVDRAQLLSEGTKKTLLLAFRLAVTECFYPDGGGLIVLDDDLLDMDPLRRKNSADLIRRFAEKNQVILLTCDPAVSELVGGNLINL